MYLRRFFQFFLPEKEISGTNRTENRKKIQLPIDFSGIPIYYLNGGEAHRSPVRPGNGPFCSPGNPQTGPDGRGLQTGMCVFLSD